MTEIADSSLSPTAANKMLVTAPASAVVDPLTPEDSILENSKAKPPRKIWVGALSFFLLTMVLGLIKAQTGWDLTWFESYGLSADMVQQLLVGAISLGIMWITPPSVADVISHLTDDIVVAAQRDPVSKVSYVLPVVQPPKGISPIVGADKKVQ